MDSKVERHSISFETFFVQEFKIVIDSWKFNILLLYIVRDDWPIFMISASNQQLQQQLEYTLLKPYGGARGVVVITVGNEHGDTSSNPVRDWLHFT